MIIIYTDGSSIGNPGPGGRGVLIVKNTKYNITSNLQLVGGEEWTTNNRMELSALIASLQWVIDNQFNSVPVCIYMDSKYVHDAIETYLQQRIARGWKLANKKPVLNKDLREKVPLLLNAIPHLSWKRVKAHATDHYNNAVDRLARGYAIKLQSSLPSDFVPPVKNQPITQPHLFS